MTSYPYMRQWLSAGPRFSQPWLKATITRSYYAICYLTNLVHNWCTNGPVRSLNRPRGEPCFRSEPDIPTSPARVRYALGSGRRVRHLELLLRTNRRHRVVASVNERGRQLRQPLCVMRFFCLSFAFLSLGFARSMHFAPYDSQRGD
jgi:hypothetical protein